jgi:hypothetical protein
MLHITQHMKGLKMQGFISINTSQKLNPFCQKCSKNERTVCRYCYARNMEINYIRLRSHLEKNYYKLETPLSDLELKEVCNLIKLENRHYIRFNSLGELSGINNLINYYRICETLPDLIFGLWTKRSNLVYKFTNNKPKNLSLIYSNLFIDQPISTIPKGFNGVFNVISYQYAIENNILPSCTGSCITCLKCYDPNKKSVVIELLKKDQLSIQKGFLKPLESIL